MTTNENQTNIRPIQAKDNAAIAALIRQVFDELGVPKVGSAYEDPMLDKLYEHYQKQNHPYFILEQNGSIIGGAGIGILEGEQTTCELQKMYLAQSARGQGLGKQLIQHCLAQAKSMGYQQCYLETMPSMLAAQAMYLKMGFARTSKAMGNTGHHSCPVWMLKSL